MQASQSTQRQSRLRVLLFGAGSIGSVYIYILLHAGAEVTAVCRSNFAAVSANGYTIDSAIFGDNLHARPTRVIRKIEDTGPQYDYVVVCSKAFPGSNPTTASLLKPIVGPQTTIALIQNGIGIENEYKRLYPSNPILSCVVYLPATQTSPGKIIMGDVERLEIGDYPSSDRPSRFAESFASLIRAGGATAILYSDIQPRRWIKLIMNASWNPICALTRLSDVAYMKSFPRAVDFVHEVMHEVASVARALGYTEVDETKVEQQLNMAKARTEKTAVQPSMLADVKEGRRMEVEAILGNVVTIADEKKVDVPYLRSLYVLAKALDSAVATGVAK